MRIGLIDLDYNGRFPNVALMKLSAFFKLSEFNTVEWYMPFNDRYDMVYISKVFSWTKDIDEHINADKVFRGGSGYNIQLIDGKEVWNDTPDVSGYMPKLPCFIEHIYPDYSLYPNLTKDTAYGYLTRGCPRNCGFCHVAQKEGTRVVDAAINIEEFWSGQKNMVLLDPNILASSSCHRWLEELARTKANIDFTQGLDARLLTEDKCKLLSKVKMRDVHFAWDRYEDGDVILPKLELFAKYNKKYCFSNHKAIVYTLTNYDTTLEQDLERIYKLRDLGYWAYVMIYDKKHCDNIYLKLQEWTNNRYIFARNPTFDSYLMGKTIGECLKFAM